MTAWTYTEKVTCWCGMPAGVTPGTGDEPELLCFAHSKMEGLLVPLPLEKPEDWTEDISGGRLYEIAKQGFIEKYVRLVLRAVSLDDTDEDAAEDCREEADDLWDDMSPEMQEQAEQMLAEHRKETSA